MFDRASMKLGLDKALLQRMDGGEGTGTTDPFAESSAPSALSKTEVETLLKKGAYGAFLDDEASTQFCEEDIDEILLRRTQTIRHDKSTEKGSIFSKASFASANTNSIDMDDPDFWDKVAEKAELNIMEELDQNEVLMLFEPRQRKQVRKFGPDGSQDADADSDDDYGLDPSTKKISPDGTKLWTQTEKSRFERCLMLYGFSSWDKMLPLFSRRTEADLEAVAQLIVIVCINSGQVDIDVVNDMRRVVGFEPQPPPFPAVEEGDPVVIDIIQLPEKPYEGATIKQTTEYRSFLLDASADYTEHLQKKAKNLLNRIQMLQQIRFKMMPHPGQPIPVIQGNPPAVWWGEDEDRDLMIGIMRYGYAAYDKIRYDPDFCFQSRLYADDPLEPAVAEEESEIIDISSSAQIEVEGISGSETVDLFSSAPVVPKIQEGALGVDVQVNSNLPDNEEKDEIVVWPGASDLGIRVRRILASFLRSMATDARRKKKQDLKHEKDLVKKEKNQEKNRQFTKKERNEFRRILLAFGVEMTPDGTKRIWDRFRELSGISKSDDVMEENYDKTISMCNECIELANSGIHTSKAIEGDDDEAVSVIRVERGHDNVSLDVAKRLLKRIEMMRKLRYEILPHISFDQNIDSLKRHQRSGLPPWWTSEYDKAFLRGVAKWGIIRTDVMVEDEELPFKNLHIEWQKAREGFLEDPKDDRFWMRETVATRRFETLCDAVLNIPAVKRTRKSKARTTLSEDDDFDLRKRNDKSPDLDLLLSSPAKKKRRLAKANNDLHSNDVSSGGDTDGVIGRVIQKLVRDKKQSHRLLYSTSPEVEDSRKTPSSEFFKSDLYKRLRKEHKRANVGMFGPPPEKPSMLLGLDMENDDDIALVLELSSNEAKTVTELFQ